MTTNPKDAVSPELLPCPFCGGEAREHKSEYDHWTEHYVECSKCGSRTLGAEPAIEEAKIWNARPSPKSKPEKGDDSIVVTEEWRKDFKEWSELEIGTIITIDQTNVKNAA